MDRHKKDMAEAKNYARKQQVVILKDDAKDKEKEEKDNKIEQVRASRDLITLGLLGKPSDRGLFCNF